MVSDLFDDLDGNDALAVLAVAPTPVLGRGLSRRTGTRPLHEVGGTVVGDRVAEGQLRQRCHQSEPDITALGPQGVVN